MQSIARQMSEGNFAVRAAVRSPDEIGALGRALNVMAARLREKIDDLAQERAKVTGILDGMVEGVDRGGRPGAHPAHERARARHVRRGHRPDRGPAAPRGGAERGPPRAVRDRRARAGSVVRRELALTAPADRTLRAHAVPLRLGPGDAGAVVVLDDVTELRRLERVRTEFIANVSHELRTPLTAIHGYLETLLGGALEEPDNARRFLEIAFRHTERLGRLLDDLTDLSNIELGRVWLRLAPTSAVGRSWTPCSDLGRGQGARRRGHARHGGERRAPRPGRPRPAGADPHQPGGQRGEVHAGRRRGDGARPADRGRRASR